MHVPGIEPDSPIGLMLDDILVMLAKSTVQEGEATRRCTICIDRLMQLKEEGHITQDHIGIVFQVAFQDAQDKLEGRNIV